MELGEFTRTLESMTPTALHAVAAGLDAYTQSTAQEVATWHAIFAVDRELRRARRTREAAVAAQRAQRAVLQAAEKAGVALPDDEVTRVARAAADVARGLLVGASLEDRARQLLEAWATLYVDVPRPVTISIADAAAVSAVAPPTMSRTQSLSQGPVPHPESITSSAA